MADQWYVVTCRISGADEDSLFIIKADGRDEASEVAEKLAWAETLDPGQTPADYPDDEFFLNYIILCGDTKPTIIEGGN